MCVWCAYTGKQQAAPLLHELGKRIEGIYSGHYTGMVIQNEGKLKLGKVSGWSRFWDDKYSVNDFPGTCGLWHSRTNSGGNYKFAHPFMSVHGVCALCGQGNSGVFAARDPEHLAMINKYFHEGMEFTSADEPYGKKYFLLDNGKQIHCSDFVIQLVEKEYLRTGNPLESIRFALTQYREEASNMFIFHDIPGKIFFATTTQRILVARYKDGMAMSISAIAFGHNAPATTEIPVNSIGCLDENSVYFEKFSPIYDNIYRIIPDNCESSMRQFLKEHGPSTFAQLRDGSILPLFKGIEPPFCTAISTYHALEALYFNNEIEIIADECQNQENGIIGRIDKIKLI